MSGRYKADGLEGYCEPLLKWLVRQALREAEQGVAGAT